MTNNSCIQECNLERNLDSDFDSTVSTEIQSMTPMSTIIRNTNYKLDLSSDSDSDSDTNTTEPSVIPSRYSIAHTNSKNHLSSGDLIQELSNVVLSVQHYKHANDIVSRADSYSKSDSLFQINLDDAEDTTRRIVNSFYEAACKSGPDLKLAISMSEFKLSMTSIRTCKNQKKNNKTALKDALNDALQKAADDGNLPAVKRLLNAGANASANHKAALSLARANNHSKVASYLKWKRYFRFLF